MPSHEFLRGLLLIAGRPPRRLTRWVSPLECSADLCRSWNDGWVGDCRRLDGLKPVARSRADIHDSLRSSDKSWTDWIPSSSAIDPIM